jgi:hypothetical protein
MKVQRWAGAAALVAGLLGGHDAGAFCGFYVSGADAKLYNNATLVVLMREGTRTVLSMQNNYQGPPEDFAMVVPVPVVLQQENVKTLPHEVFRRVDELSAPRLVEYWEQNPCQATAEARAFAGSRDKAGAGAAPVWGGGGLGVTVEAEFAVGEYQVVVLSAKDSSGLDTYLRQEKYQIPAGAEPILRPYVQAGSKFFVARVDLSKVVKQGDRTMLSPLRFHYDSERFDLPVRLGLLNSSGKQDLLVHILAKGKRYEVANYPNAFIPTNLDVGEITKEQFSTFYTALFDRTIEEKPKAVVTEYSWDAGSCDPCPTPALTPQELATLGADVLPDPGASPSTPGRPGDAGPAVRPPVDPLAPPPGRRSWRPSGFTLTRLHARYSKDALGEDLVFKEAPAVAGGREFLGNNGKLEPGAQPSSSNHFQARYAIRHPWAGPIDCPSPRRGVWGGPPQMGQNKPTKSATDLAFAPRGQTPLPRFLTEDLAEFNVKGESPRPSSYMPPGVASASASASASARPSVSPSASAALPRPADGERRSCAGCAIPAPGANLASAFAALLCLGTLAARRRR